MRLIYLDESGTGRRKLEPHVIVLGVIIDADRQWKTVESYMQRITAKYSSLLGRPNLIFHANEILSGTLKGAWPEDRFDENFRLRALRILCGIPKLFDLPVVVGYVARADVESMWPDDSIQEQTKNAQAASSVRCVTAVEKYMREIATKDEVALMIYENTQHARSIVRQMHNFLRMDGIESLPQFQKIRSYLPIRRIVDTAHFADKSDTCMLQIADACAFAVRRSLAKAKHGEELLNCFRSQLPSSSAESLS